MSGCYGNTHYKGWDPIVHGNDKKQLVNSVSTRTAMASVMSSWYLLIFLQSASVACELMTHDYDLHFLLQPNLYIPIMHVQIWSL